MRSAPQHTASATAARPTAMRATDGARRDHRVPMALAAAAVVLITGWAARWNADDAFVVFRVVEHVLAGNGPVFNAGERVEAVTSPVWLALLVLVTAATPLPVEWLAVLLGLGFAAAGVAMAVLAAAAVEQRRGGILVPAGVLVWLGLAPAWHYATSGLETGLGFAWLGACALALARRLHHDSGRNAWPAAVLLGLGPLVRPDFAVFSAVFLLALIVGEPRRWPERVRLAVMAGALPFAVEVARMGYYAALVPNTALAKEASLAHWPQGLRYLTDFATPYLLAVPLATVAWLLLQRSRVDDRRARVVRLAPAVGGALYGLAVVRGGGDFMHARLLLPALFAMLTPVAVVRVHAPSGLLRQAALTPVAVLVVWAVVAGVALRPPVELAVADDGIIDERAFHVRAAGHSAPVTLEDYRGFARVTRGLRARDLAAMGRRALIVDEVVHPLAGGTEPTVVYEAGAVGLASVAAGPAVHVVDRLGLGDAYAARLRLERRGRPGHEKPLPPAWIWARFGTRGGIPAAEVRAAAAARRALVCPPLLELHAAVTAPLTPARVLRNIALAPRLTTLRFPADPQAAAAQLCAHG